MHEAVKKIAEYLKAGVKANQIELSTIDVEEKEVRVTGILWSTIAEKL